MSTNAEGKSYAVFHTNQGEFTVELFSKEAPITVDNFKKLAEKGFYDGTIFHRIIPEFMIQGGDPEGTGRGGPGYYIPDEFAPDLTFSEPGILAMANAGPGTGGSQFFVTVVPTPWLQNHHSIFGKVVQNYDVVEALSKVKTNAFDKPLDDVVIESLEITDKI
jgi:cyclophilin family peptidyl-prolyl cis-trans isomerase